MKTLLYGILTLVLINIQETQAQTYRIDSTFGTNGVYLVPLLSDSNGVVVRSSMRYLKVDSDDNIIVSAFYTPIAIPPKSNAENSYLTKIFHYGGLDTNFGSAGNGFRFQFFPKFPRAMRPFEKLHDDRMLMGEIREGTFRSYVSLRRFKKNGTADYSYGFNGDPTFSTPKLKASFYGMSSDSIGFVYIIGKTYETSKDYDKNIGEPFIIKIDTFGSINKSFSRPNGFYLPTFNYGRDSLLDFHFIKVLNNNLIALLGSHHDSMNSVGRDYFIVLMDKDGSPLTNFGNKGMVVFPRKANEIIHFTQPNVLNDKVGNLYVVFHTTDPSNPHRAMINVYKLAKNGMIVSGYAQGGRLLIPDVMLYNFGHYSTALHEDDKLLVLWTNDTNQTNTVNLARYTNDGQIDNSFSGYNLPIRLTSGKRDYFSYLDVQRNGDIIIGGEGHTNEELTDTVYCKLIRFTNKDKTKVTNVVLNQANISVYPNPAKEEIHVLGLNDSGTLSIVNVNGQIWHQCAIENEQELKISINEWPAGVYFIKYTNKAENAMLYKTFVKM